MNNLQKIKNILFKPNICWTSLEKEKRFSKVISYLLLVILIGGVIYYSINSIGLDTETIEKIKNATSLDEKFNLSTQILVLIGTLVIFFLIFIGTFINSGLIHIFVKIFKGKGKYLETYKAVTYGSTPQILLWGVPLIGFLTTIYMFYLQIVGLNKLHKITMEKSVFAFVLSNIVFWLLILLVSIFLISTLYLS